MNLDDLQELDFENVGSWPVAAHAAAVVIIFIAVLFAGYFFHIEGMQAQLDDAESQEGQLKTQLAGLQAKVVDLNKFQTYLDQMEDIFGESLRQLPSEAEVASLIEDVSEAGVSNQLVFKSFEPGKEKPEEFYAQLPITIEVEGTYHQLGHFVNNVASLPRIVSLHDLELRPIPAKPGLLEMSASANIYWYLVQEGQ